jgi:hypothetical protein
MLSMLRKYQYVFVHKVYRRFKNGEVLEAVFNTYYFSALRIRKAYKYILDIDDKEFDKRYRIVENVKAREYL